MLYTTIHHPIRKELGLSCNEYCIADMIYHLSANPKAPVLGWCSQSRGNMADEMGLSRRTVIDIVNTLIAKGLVERNSVDFLRTTAAWYDTVVNTKQGVQKVHTHLKTRPEEGAHPVNFSHTTCAESSQQGCAGIAHKKNTKENNTKNRERESAIEIEDENQAVEPDDQGKKSPPVADAPPLPVWDLEVDPEPDAMAEFEAELKGSRKWIQDTASNLKRGPAWIEEHIGLYISAQRLTGQDKGREFSEVKRHCFYWLKEQNERQLRNEPRTNNHTTSANGTGSQNQARPARSVKTSATFTDDEAADYIRRRYGAGAG